MRQAFTAHYLFSFGDLHLVSSFSKNNKIKSGKIYRHKFMHVSRSTEPFTNHSWQDWRSIYNSHIDFKISPTMIWVHRKKSYARRCTKSLVQRYKAKLTYRQNSTKLIKPFDFSTFYVFLDFWHKSKKRLIKKKCTKNLKQKHK